MYKLIMCDFDGTLAHTDKTVSEATRKVIKRYQAMGGIFTVATGRSMAGIVSQLSKIGLDGLDLPIVSYQGAFVKMSVTNRVMVDLPLDSALAVKIVEACRAQRLFIQAYDNDDGSVVVEENHPSLQSYSAFNDIPYKKVEDLVVFVEKNTVHKILTWMEPERFDEVQPAMRALFGSECNICRSSNHFLEFYDLRAGKGRALKILAKHFDVSVSETLAFGDQFNDLDMIAVAGTGVAVANAVPSLLETADAVTDSNDDDGVAKYIAKSIDVDWTEFL